ncbi:multidrug efflux SMR transporter [Micromonospora peucetia]|uniref:Spermidine export protein MdtJ n=1 Tax=Micromonospora peucetia TaxID=47871 RepID=A0A1C6W2P4_9ACTN|nr:multidrug efflux SMR transporter [Micromonospora peucetia]MCX4391200.1 multidrug efflux SMR transporter [Micromonospora peucetia]WSA32112.1 multidrug efflux SMR transporter [Micromonospora peucetia]SCL72786.1 small multidrug resistance pump [Micromonospora peucetia]
MRQWLYLGGAIGLEVTGTLALRAANDHSAWIALVVVGYTLSFVFLSAVLREGMPIGVAYGIWAASGVTLTALLAALLFGDALTWVMGLGFAVIVAGVLLVELGSHQAEPRRSTPQGAHNEAEEAR